MPVVDYFYVISQFFLTKNFMDLGVSTLESPFFAYLWGIFDLGVAEAMVFEFFEIVYIVALSVRIFVQRSRLA
uniref:YqgF/RNase H-like domain-containing protein n=1 Tax=Parascaris univalens TaxID=6257 RepID=A0A915C7I1_PARUN